MDSRLIFLHFHALRRRDGGDRAERVIGFAFLACVRLPRQIPARGFSADAHGSGEVGGNPGNFAGWPSKKIF